MAKEAYIADFEGKSLPFSNEAEQSVLGSILIDPPSINLVLDRLKAEYFYIPQNRKIFEILTAMSMSSKTIDFVTVLEQLKSENLYDDAGGKQYLSTIVSTVPTSANIGTYADIIRDRFYMRSLITASRDIIEKASEGGRTGELMDYAEQRVYEIRQGRELSGLKRIDDIIIGETFDRLTKLTNEETRKDYIGISTGFSGLDKLITGLNKSDLIIIGARPGMGKTAFALNVARNVAVNENKTVAFFSLEMSRDQLAQRILSSEAMISSGKMRTGELTTEEWNRLAEASRKLNNVPLYFDESSGITVPEIKAKIRRMNPAPDVVMIDYLGLMQSAVKKENRAQEISDITRNLKILAKEMKITVIACAQLNREVDSKSQKTHIPQLSDLRESGSIEQDADIVLFMYRKNYYAKSEDENGNTIPQDPEEMSKAKCIVAKNRHGGIDSVPLHWDGEFTKFSSVEVFRND